MTKFVVKIVFITIACLFLVFSYGLAIFGFLFPSPMVRMSDSLGLNGMGAMFSMRVYNQNPTEANRLDALERNIDAGRHRQIIILFEGFDDEWQDEANGFHRQAYVRALLNRGHYGRALGFVDYEALAGDINLLRPCLIYFVFAEHSSRGFTQAMYDGVRSSFEVYVAAFRYEWENHNTLSTYETAMIQVWFVNILIEEGIW
ncbi:MAG: hypothetical protein FWE45_04870 [Firmicutes bacterium]|nr:hypothetical protein [Bacillota bacterium]